MDKTHVLFIHREYKIFTVNIFLSRMKIHYRKKRVSNNELLTVIEFCTRQKHVDLLLCLNLNYRIDGCLCVYIVLSSKKKKSVVFHVYYTRLYRNGKRYIDSTFNASKRSVLRILYLLYWIPVCLRSINITPFSELNRVINTNGKRRRKRLWIALEDWWDRSRVHVIIIYTEIGRNK